MHMFKTHLNAKTWLIGGLTAALGWLGGQAQAQAFKPVGGQPDLETATFVYDAATGLKLQVIKPVKPAPKGRAAVLAVHGGGWVMGTSDWTVEPATRLAQQGYVGISVQYRLADKRTVTPIDQIDDVCRAFKFVRQNSNAWGVDASRVGGMGWSAGGHLVTETALRGCREIAGPALLGGRGMGGADALLLWSPALDTTLFPGFESLLLNRIKVWDISPVHQVYFAPPPTLILHGDGDIATPPGTGWNFCTSTRRFNTVCDVHVYPGVGHMLAKDLNNQLSGYDPDPKSLEDGWKKMFGFLGKVWPGR